MNISKSQLRDKIKGERLLLSPDVHQTLSADICARALAYCLELKPVGDSITLAGYSTTKNEADVYPLLEDWCSSKHAISWAPYMERHACLPAIAPPIKQLHFLQWMPDSTLMLNRYAIAEPLADAPELIPDVILVPLLAFDRSGNRLGYGAGYYDETLQNLRKIKDIVAIGVAFGFQEVAEVPAESFDERLDMVITERETIDCA
jgi:5-formyltetrahydrofolate cyclo-ligase